MFRDVLTIGIIFSLVSSLLSYSVFRYFAVEGPVVVVGIMGSGLMPFAGVLLYFWQQNKLVEDIVKSRQLFKHLSQVDETTQINNKRYFLEQFDLYLKGLRLQHFSSALLMIDVDFFKGVNDRYGHPVGDKVLHHIAETIALQLRDNDLLGRYGGEEFIILLTRTQIADAYRVAERIRKKVAETPFFLEDGHTIEVSISIGLTVAFVDKKGTQIISDADKALYRAKSRGRNRVERFEATGMTIR